MASSMKVSSPINMSLSSSAINIVRRDQLISTSPFQIRNVTIYDRGSLAAFNLKNGFDNLFGQGTVYQNDRWFQEWWK